MKHYDLAVLGGGLAGLSALYHLQLAGKLDGRKVLLADPLKKEGNDRTWSFWEREAGPFEDIVSQRWDRIDLYGDDVHFSRAPAPYTYKLIRSADFYAKTQSVIEQIPGLDRVHAAATQVTNHGDRATFDLAGETVSADLVYSSVPHPVDHRKIKQPYLDQHFRGWYVETEEDTFDPGVATIMDFRTPQLGETRFFYVLPFSPRRAVVEIAIFSNRHLRTEEYDSLLDEYIRLRWTREKYRIEHTEAGNIPMTTFPFPRRDGRILYIGTGGGDTRPSTGYTFYGVQRMMAHLAEHFPQVPDMTPWPRRHLLYDATLLRILQDGKLAGDRVFLDLFRKNPTERVFAFLNGESTLAQEVALMSSVPVGTFASTFVGELVR